MVKSKKYAVLGGVKVSSEQLSEWGSSGGRPKKYASNAEKVRAYKLRKKQEKFGVEAQLEPRQTYGEVKIKRLGKCSNCGTIDDQYRYGWENYAWTRSSDRWTCFRCYGSMEKQELKSGIKRAGSNAERSRRSRGKS